MVKYLQYCPSLFFPSLLKNLKNQKEGERGQEGKHLVTCLDGKRLKEGKGDIEILGCIWLLASKLPWLVSADAVTIGFGWLGERHNLALVTCKQP